jgi:phosphatidylglycerophosphatase A
LKTKLAEVFSTFFGVGLFPVGPGTIASLITVFIYKFFLYSLNWPLYLLITILLTAAGIYTSTVYAKALNLKDPGKVVIDEVAGQLVALFLLPAEWKILLSSFLLFRLFDIIKPLGVKKLEDLPWGWGIMADDLASGLAVNLLMHLVIFLFKIK